MTGSRIYSTAVVLGCALAFLRCGQEQLAGSSVTTGNPTEIQVSFTGENGPVALTGRVDVYGATQIPIPGFRPEPLASFEVADGQGFRLAAEDVAAIPDSLWPAGSLEGDSLARFNLVFAGEGQGAIVRELGLRRKAGEFLLGSAARLARTRDIAGLDVGLRPLTEYQVYIDPESMLPNLLHYLFLKGTGFAARGEGGVFRFKTLPDGSHPVSFVALPDPAQLESSGDRDSAFVYNLDRPISSSGMGDTLSFTDLEFGLVMPDLYKFKK